MPPPRMPSRPSIPVFSVRNVTRTRYLCHVDEARMEGAARAREDGRVLPDPTDFCRLWLLRHPELDAEHAQRAIGDGPADLSRRGRAQVLRWLELLKPVTVGEVWASPQ